MARLSLLVAIDLAGTSQTILENVFSIYLSSFQLYDLALILGIKIQQRWWRLTNNWFLPKTKLEPKTWIQRRVFLQQNGSLETDQAKFIMA
jgi:hypothetical protein